MRNILLCILTCLILTCCESNSTKDIDYYKVENFEFSGKVDSYVSACRETYTGKLNIYNMDLSKDGDTIHVSYATRENVRFLVGDSIFLWWNRWLLKN